MEFSDLACDRHSGTLLDSSQALPTKKGRTPLKVFLHGEKMEQKKEQCHEK